MTGEALLVTALAVASTLSAGLSAGVARRAHGALAPGLGGGALAAVVVANAVGLPLLAWWVAGLAGQGAAAAGGIVVAAAAPGGSTGPLLAVLAGGDPLLAARLFLMLTGAGTVGGVLAALAFETLSLGEAGRAIAIVAASAVVPLMAGWLIGARRPAAARAVPWLARASLALLVATVAVLAIRHGHRASARDLAVAAVVVLASLIVGVAVRPRARAIAVAQVSAVRNLTLALLVLAASGSAPEATSAVLAYGLVMFVAAGGVALIARAAERLDHGPRSAYESNHE